MNRRRRPSRRPPALNTRETTPSERRLLFLVRPRAHGGPQIASKRQAKDGGDVVFQAPLLYPCVLFYKGWAGDEDGVCVDARIYGNEARFVRRSCRPTARVVHTLQGGLLQLYLVADRDLAPGEEITIPFDFDYRHWELKIDLLGAISMLSRSWADVKKETIQNCFRHAGFRMPGDDTPNSHSTANTAGVSAEVWNERAEFPGAIDGSTFDEFVSADDDVPITG
ncbi:hypothetical protein HPB51_013655 [Rhipicephalus microplus]|uniref:SET domain-containing protein n=1 Tax=Rhipicephalus microplus TaxID=6941 RepID=A0A9J6EA47_RHIMP|nr:hypothetical protein HPB51_013655 [Rhipicephalus microplus]